jgi:hypothetical protein
VHEPCVHLLHDDLRRLSAGRDHHPDVRIDAATLDELAAGLDETNNACVAIVAQTLSPRLTRELLAWTAAPSAELSEPRTAASSLRCKAAR